MSTWYMTTFDRRIEAVEVVKETEKQVVYVTHGREQRSAKISDYHYFSPTWEGAKGYLVDQAETALENARYRVDIAEQRLSEARALTKPEGVEA